MLIGQVARRADVHVQTLRYYELRGLLPATKRRASGYREYDTEVVPVVRFIKNAQELGFTLREIAELIALRSDRSRRPAAVRERASRKIGEMDRRIRQLTSMKAELTSLVAKCNAATPKAACAIITAIDAPKLAETGSRQRG